MRRWIDAVLAHHPGVVDRTPLDAAATPSAVCRTVAADLEKVLGQDFRTREARNDVRRRGALLPTDIALRLPGEAAAFSPGDAAPPPRPNELDRMGRPVAKPTGASLVCLVDGRRVALDTESGQWSFASRLLAGVTNASTDEFVRLWHRAVAAVSLYDHRLDNASYQLQRARRGRATPSCSSTPAPSRRP